MSLSYFCKYLFVTVLFVSGCDANENMNIEGRLVYTDGGASIDVIDFGLAEVSFSSIYKSEDMSAINGFSTQQDGSIVFGRCRVNGRCEISRYSMDTDQYTFIRTGYLPTLVDSHEKLFFYDRVSDSKGWLSSAPISKVGNVSRIAQEPDWEVLPNGIRQAVTTPIIQISENEILFLGKDRKLWLHNIAQEKTTSTNIMGCRPILWMENDNQLLCSDWDTWDIYSVDITKNKKLELPSLNGAYGFVYVADSDALIYGRTRSTMIIGETYDIFLYSFGNKTERIIKKDSHIAGGIWMGVSKGADDK